MFFLQTLLTAELGPNTGFLIISLCVAVHLTVGILSIILSFGFNHSFIHSFFHPLHNIIFFSIINISVDLLDTQFWVRAGEKKMNGYYSQGFEFSRKRQLRNLQIIREF